MGGCRRARAGVDGAMHLPQPISRRRRLCLWALSCGLFALQACAAPHVARPKLHGVLPFDLGRYAGTWYEVAALPNPFQRDCTATQATYTPTPKGEVEVHNLCHKHTLGGPISEVRGRAWAPDAAQPSELKVRFFWPFTGDYFILALDPDYQWAVVGQPQRRYLWVLSRSRHMSPALFTALKARLPGWGYDPEQLRPTPQP